MIADDDKGFEPSVEDLEGRELQSAIAPKASDPTVPKPPTNPSPEPPPEPEPNPGPFNPKPPINLPPPLGGPVGPA